MKKLFVVSTWGLMLLAPTAFAQSTGNNSTVLQNGSGNIAGVDQLLDTGAFNTSNVYQGIGGNTNPSSASSAAVAQIGGAGSEITSEITQNDASHRANVQQNGALGGTLNSTVYQSNSSNSTGVTQTSSNPTDLQESYVNQTGQLGLVVVEQKGVSDSSSVDQSGYGSNHDVGRYVNSGSSWNYVFGGVSVSQTGAFSNDSIVTQDNDYSGVLVSQQGTTGTNTSLVTQLLGGSGNFVFVKQR
jgi:hypothetical protein